MDTLKLEKWSELLLDTGKRNNLINFKNRYSSVAEIVYPASCEIFKKSLSDCSFEPVNLEDAGKIEYPQDALEDEKRQLFAINYSYKVKKASDVLLYTGAEKTFNTLKNISKKARVALEETGVNIAYFAFGFIHWKDGDASEFCSAPILLIPITFENRGANKLPKIHVLESEITLNPSFAYKCEKEFGFALPEYQDQDLPTYLQEVTLAVNEQGWIVTDECKIGTFSFLKINMYRDIEDNAEQILANQNVKILLGESGVSHIIEDDICENLHNIVDADSSQEEAISAIKRGKSIVLQGPPGTGKSQTITNIIAECLADGKKVLFVSEKLAALNVVYEKLKREGLSEFCLELHSHKANKKDLLLELCSTLKSDKLALSQKVSEELNAVAQAKAKLNNYKNSLHCNREKINKSVYELINGYFECGLSPEFIYQVKNIGEIQEEQIEKRIAILEEISGFSESVGYDYRKNCWYGYINTDNSFIKLSQIKKRVGVLQEFIAKIQSANSSVYEQLKVNCSSLKQIKNLSRLANLFSQSNTITPLIIDNGEDILQGAKAQKELSEKILNLRAQIDEYFKIEFYDSQYLQKAFEVKQDLVNKYRTIVSRIFCKGYKQIKTDLTAYLKEGKSLNYAKILNLLEKAFAYNLLVKDFDKNQEKLEGCFGDIYNGFNTDWVAVIKDIDAFNCIAVECEPIRELASLSTSDYNALKPTFSAVNKLIAPLFDEYSEELSQFEMDCDSEIFNYNQQDLAVVKNKIQDMCENADMLSDWCLFLKVLNKASKNDLVDFTKKYLDKELDIELLSTVYKREAYREYVEYIVNGDETLSVFSRVSQDKAVNLFATKDKLSFEVNKAIIRSTIGKLRPDLSYVAPGSEVSLILHEGKKKRMQKGVRRLLAEAGGTIQLLKPCFLMSPLSVSTFLSADKTQFDVVIFDEASQIFPQDAIGAIYRGKQLVVVGDSKQMPPSDFFMNTVTGAIEDEGAEEEVSDYESILDICSACFPQKRLRWHYRSKHESLIAFSNQHFYDNRLVTFPSTAINAKGMGVDYYNAKGVYEQNLRINRAEAELVCDLVFEHFKNSPEKSLGVVAFSMSQQNYIEKVINARRLKNPDYEKFFKEDSGEYFFIKNLETVQGDERDVIIFSVAYAYNSSGKFIHNFGPLNHKGGERRLNVAVTRAKTNVKLVCSITSGDIDLNRTNAEGARLLKEYLAYAESGGAKEQNSLAHAVSESGFENAVADFISTNGFIIEQKVGKSSAKIDIAVKDAFGDNYTIAVECDGESYSSYKTARDRERLRKQVLESMGWNYYRVWSTEWFKNRKAEEQKLLSRIKSASIKSEIEPTTFKSLAKSVESLNAEKIGEVAIDYISSAVNDKDEGEIEITPSDFSEEEIWADRFLSYEKGDLGFATYQTANLEELWEKHGEDFITFVKEVLKIEAPLNERWFLKRIVTFFNRSVVNEVMENMYNQKMLGCEEKGIIRKNGFLYLAEQTTFALRLPSHTCRRNINNVSLEEIASGLYKIIKHNVNIQKEGLFRTLAYRLGIMKMSAMAQVRMEQALILLAKNIKIEGSMISLK